jgi:2-dehydro-3-deoxyphosphooctonate aldolase (KDO 8-P synthase)
MAGRAGPVARIGGYEVGTGRLLLIAGPCVIESEESVQRHARRVREVAGGFPVNVIFKASFDKANRTSVSSFRGPGPDEGSLILERVRQQTGLPVLTDVHETAQVDIVAPRVDVLQIPAFLCRQTDLIAAAARRGKAVNIKKGQFVAPEDMRFAVEKAQSVGQANVLLTERGSTFGYHNLVVDFRSLVEMRAYAPVCFDATHSVQRPSGSGGKSGGDRTLAPVLARAAAAVGIDALFAEVHENPDQALSDGPNSLTFDLLHEMLREVCAVRSALAP